MSGSIYISPKSVVHMGSSTFNAIRNLLAWGIRGDGALVEDSSLKDWIEWCENTRVGHLSLEEFPRKTLRAVRDLLIAGSLPEHPIWPLLRQGYQPELRRAIAKGDAAQIAQCEAWENSHRECMRKVADAIDARLVQDQRK